LESASVLVSFPGDFLETPSGFSEYANFMTISEKTLGFEQCIPLAKSGWFTGVYSGLTKAGYPFLISDTALKPEAWQRFKALVLGTYEYLSSSLQRNLVEFVKSGHTVVIGPRVPTHDEQMFDDATIKDVLDGAKSSPLLAGGLEVGSVYQVGNGTFVLITDWAQPTEALEAALGSAGLVSFRRNDPRLDVTIHKPVGGNDHWIVFLANPTSERIDAKLSLDAKLKSAQELWTGRKVALKDGVVSEVMPPYSINIYKFEL
jgi:beta-galactosidase